MELLLWEIKATERPSFCPFSALHCAAASGSQICLQLLLESGCEDFINAVDGSGRTPLHIAAQSGSFESVQLILGKPKADLDAQDRWGQTALTVAVKCGFDLIVDFLLKMGADANQADINGNTALHHACKHRLENVANLLLATEGVGDAGLINRQNSDMRTYLTSSYLRPPVLYLHLLYILGLYT